MENSAQVDGHIGSQVYTERSDWEFLRAFYHLNNALHHAGVTSQKDRVALNKAHEHLNELQTALCQSNAARGRLENELHEERQEHRMSQENLNHERARHKQTEKSLECIWTSHNRLGDIVSKVDGEYKVAELVLELASKAQRIDELESTLKEAREQHGEEIQQFTQRLQLESAQHTQEYMNQSQQIHHLQLFVQEHMKGLTMEPSIERKRVGGKGRGRARRNKPDSQLPFIKEESF